MGPRGKADGAPALQHWTGTVAAPGAEWASRRRRCIGVAAPGADRRTAAAADRRAPSFLPAGLALSHPATAWPGARTARLEPGAGPRTDGPERHRHRDLLVVTVGRGGCRTVGNDQADAG